jgi:iron-sulfur cluster assembly accessory protein
MVTLSDVARGKLEEVIAQQVQHGATVYGLRLMAAGGGCSGPRYGMALAERAEEGDWVGEFGGVRVLVDQESAALLSGARIEFIETLERSGFTIENPNAVATSGGTCGCHGDAADGGESSGGCGCGGH